MTVFETLLVAHVLGDWLLQTEWQAVNKGRNWKALVTHVVVYHVVLFIALGIKLGFDQPLVYAVVGVLALVHGILDRQGFIQWLMRALRIVVERQPERWLSIAVDQSVHFVLLAAAAILLSRYAGG
jgi:hypothetical protein